jgi:hypothetical protein
MPVTIDVPTLVQVPVSPAGIATLPRITIAPEATSAWVVGVEVQLTATPAGGSIPAHLMTALRSAYTLPAHDPAVGHRLVGPIELEGQAAVGTPGVSEASVAITVRARYRERDSVRSETSPPVKWYFAQPRPAAVRSVVLTLEPPLVPVRDQGESAVLTAVVRNGPSGQPPALTLTTRPEGCPNLARAVEDLLKTPFSRHDEKGGEVRWRMPVELRLDDSAKSELRNLTAYGSLNLLCLAAVGPAQADFTLIISPNEADFPGVLAIDLGTSNSTVTLYDPNYFPNHQGFLPEHERRIRELVAERLVDAAGARRLEGVKPDQWDQLVGSLTLDGDGPPEERLPTALAKGGRHLLEALRQIEIHVAALPIRRQVRAALQDIYEAAFVEPRLESHKFIWVELDRDPNPDRAADRGPPRKDILSELQLLALGKPHLVRMGRAARSARLEATTLAVADDGDADRTPENGVATLADVRAEFHISPKRYLGSRDVFPGRVNGKRVQVLAREVLQAAWNHLVEQTNAWRRVSGKRLSRGVFPRVVVTYPTVSTPAVRAQVAELVKGLGFKQVVADYDEAVAAAFFYFHRELGGSLDLGPELFKSRSRVRGGSGSSRVWSQNVLVVDIGGGSTDVALIRLEMRDKTPEFRADEDRGGGGRLYEVTPWLLGSSGNTHLGGDLITLRVYQLLKATLADKLLEAVQSGATPSETLTARIGQLAPGFKDADGRFRQGSITRPVTRYTDDDGRADDQHRGTSPGEQRRVALEMANLVLPTKWASQPDLVSGFYKLWELAEHAKVEFLSRRTDYELSAAEVREILPLFRLTDLARPPEFTVRLSAADFEGAAEDVIREAVRIARGLLADRLPKDPDNPKAQEPLDWLILSGKTWNLESSRDVLRREFQQSPQFTWNPDRVTFDREYAKLATSVGACYADVMSQLVQGAEAAKAQLRLGFNQLIPRVENLFWFLPCSFLLQAQDWHEELFQAGAELHQLDREPVGKVRSEPKGVRLGTTLLRRDFVGAREVAWNKFDGNELAEAVGMSPQVFRDTVWGQFEVDHRLLMRLYLWQTDRAELPRHYEFDPATPGVTLAPAVPQPGADPPVAGCDVGVLAEEGVVNGRRPVVVIRANDLMTAVFHIGGETVRGILVDRLGDHFRHGRLTVVTRAPDQSEWVRAEHGLDQPGREVGSHYPRWYQLTLDEKGTLRVHFGRVPYWLTTDPQVWHREPGRVLLRELDPVGTEPLPGRDPFDGNQ